MAEYLQKLNQLDRELASQSIHEQVQEINQTVQLIEQKEAPQQAIKPLGLLPDQFEDVLDQIGESKRGQLTTLNHLLNGFRQFLSLRFGIWSLPNLTTAQLIKEELHVSTALEIMAGNGYWSKALEEAGIETISTDSLEWAKTSNTGQKFFTSVENLDAVSAIKKYKNVDLILCSWSPNFGKNDIAVIDYWKRNCSNKLLFIGEEQGATNSPEFWENTHFIKDDKLTKINRSFRSFDFIDEKIFEIDRQ